MVAVALLAMAGSCLADTPAFDRPGIAFSTTTIPRGGLSVELGVPDFTHTSAAGISSTLYSLDTNFRAGLGRFIEVQLATPVFNHQDTSGGGISGSATGVGDSSLYLKAPLPASADRFSWAVLGGVTLATGQDPFTAGTARYRLATSMSLKLNDTQSAGFYMNFQESAGDTGYTLSPSFNVALSDRLSGYLEVGYTHFPHIQDSTIAGGGLAWMIAPTVQLDISLDLGMTPKSPGAQGGVGVSFYIR